MSIGTTVVARAHANIALVKYWGKRNAVLNLPAAGSLSMTLAALTTTTRVRFSDSLVGDQLVLDGQPAGDKALRRVSRWLDLVREAAGIDARAEIVSDNDFPTASGLASSASAFAALATAAPAAAGLALSDRERSVLARRGSGSAARSIYGGFALMNPGREPDGSDACAEPLDLDPPWDLRMVVAVCGGTPKKHGSREAMDHCADTSPLYAGFIGSVPGDVASARAAIEARDVHALGRVTEASALAMHAAAMASRPAIIYFQPPTLACMARVEALREHGVVAYYTMDAGPHVKVLTRADDSAAVAAALGEVAGVTQVIVSDIGGPAVVVSAEDPT
jgi:diphosphomevalonate decarboxylase